MTSFAIRNYPDPVLKKVAEPVVRFDGAIQTFVGDLLQTMYKHRGVGLAAPQVGISKRVFVVDIWWTETHETNKALVFINPQLTLSETKQRGLEGCLSLPGVREHINGASELLVKAFDAEGRPFEMKAEGFLAVAIQHENDHLDGITMFDHMSPLERRYARKSLRV